MKYYTFFCLSLFVICSYSQTKTISFFSTDNEPVSDFQLNFYMRDSLKIYKSYEENKFVYEKSSIKKLDSIIIIFNSFYSQKLDTKKFIKTDSIFLKKEISLEEVVINKKIKNQEIGVVAKEKKIFKIGRTSKTDELVELNASEYKNASIESISIYIFEKFRDLYNDKHNNKNINIKFYIFQSDTNPNENIVNLLDEELIVNTKEGNKGWVNIDLKELKLKIKDYKYLYIGYSTLGNPIAIGAVKRKNIIGQYNIKSYIKNSKSNLQSVWRESHYKVYNQDALSEPSIKIKIRK